MMPSQVEFFTPTLSKYPNLTLDTSLTQFTEGDLHANTMRLIESLVHFGVIDVSQKDYQDLLSLYRIALSLSDRNTNKNLLKLIKRIRVKDKNFLVRLIGDTLADRTGNDLFTLTLIDHLLENDCNLRILISNHDIHFLTAVIDVSCIAELSDRALEDEFFSTGLFIKQGGSFLRLVESVERDEISFSELKRIANQYFSTLLLLDYAVSSDNQLEIFSHAPINLDTLRMLGTQFNVNFPGDTSPNQAKIEFINEINKVFCAYVKYGDSEILKYIFDENDGKAAFKVIWQREYDQDFKFINSSFPIINIYGHDKSLPGKVHANIVRLDNAQGKGNLDTNSCDHTAFATNSSVSLIPKISHKDIHRALRVLLKLASSNNKLGDFREVIGKRVRQIKAWSSKSLLTEQEAKKHLAILELRMDEIIQAQCEDWNEIGLEQGLEKYFSIISSSAPVRTPIASQDTDPELFKELKQILQEFFNMKLVPASQLAKSLLANEAEGDRKLRELIQLLDESRINQYIVNFQERPKAIFGKVVIELQKRQQELQVEKYDPMNQEQELDAENDALTHLTISSTGLNSFFVKVQSINDSVLEERDLCEKLEPHRKVFLATKLPEQSFDHCSSKSTHQNVWAQLMMDILSALIFIASCTLSYWVTGKLRLFLVEIDDSQNDCFDKTVII